MEGKIYIVTGVTGSIGGAIAQKLDELGARLILPGRDLLKINDFIENKLNGTQHIGFQMDLGNIGEILGFSKDIIKLGLKIDGIVHAAGIAEVRPIKLTTPDFLTKVFNINFNSFIELIRCFSHISLRNVELNIVGISAIGAFQGNATKTAYCASKAAMNAAVKCLAIELADKGIRINTVAPGATESKMVSDLVNLPGGEQSLQKIKERQVLGICEPQDIANAVIFLLSDSSRMITGTCLPVDGGKLAS